MNIKNIFLIFTFTLHLLSVTAQNQINLFDFAGIPQAIMLNPSYELDSDYFVNIPFSGNQVHLGSSGVDLYDLFADNNVPVEQKFRTTIYGMSPKDVFLVNQKNEVISVGYKIDSSTFLSFGYYEEFDLYSNFPKSMAELFYEGTTNVGKRYQIDNFAFQIDLLGIYHIGLQKQINNSLNLGARLKLYSGAFNIKSKNNSGTAYIDLGNDNQFRYGLSLVDVQLQTSGAVYDNYDFVTRSYIQKRLLLTGNKGIGIDLGFTYFNDYNLSISGSITDFGVLYNSNNSKIYSVKGNYQTEGIELEFDPDNPVDYWTNLEDEFQESIDYTEEESSYISWRSTQINTFVRYAFGEKRYAECNYYGETGNHFSRSAIGALFQLQRHPETILPTLSVFYERNFSNVFQSRISYSVDKFNYSDIGLAISANVWKINTYLGVNNVIGLINLAKANNASVQFGININSRNFD